MAIAGFHGHDIGQVMEPRLASVLTPRERSDNVKPKSNILGVIASPRMRASSRSAPMRPIRSRGVRTLASRGSITWPIYIGQVMEPRLASVLTPRERMGRIGAERLLARIRGEAITPKMLDLGFTLSLRSRGVRTLASRGSITWPISWPWNPAIAISSGIFSPRRWHSNAAPTARSSLVQKMPSSCGYSRMLDAGMTPYSVMVEQSSSYSSGIELMRQARREYPQLDGIFCTNDDLAVGAA